MVGINRYPSPSPVPSDDSKSGSSEPNPNKANEPLKQIGRGFLLIVSAPFAIAGMGLQAVGTVLEGGSMLLQGLGAVGKIPLDKVRESAKEDDSEPPPRK